MSPNVDTNKKFKEKSAFEDDDSEEEALVGNAASHPTEPFAASQSEDVAGVKRTLSDTVEEQKL